jgi:hypothetical protein
VRIARGTQEEIARELTPEQRAEFEKLDRPIVAKVTEWAQKEITVRSLETASPQAKAGP